MVGGGDAVVSAAMPVLNAMGSTVEHMGPAAAGTATKLVNQALVGVHSQATAEALLLAGQLGVSDLHKLVRLISKSWGGSRIFSRSGTCTADAAAAGGGLDHYAASAAPLRNLAKDLRIIQSASGSKCVPDGRYAAVHSALQLFTRMEEAGFGGHDIAAAIEVLDAK